MEVDRNLIERVASVARLKLSEQEISKFIPQMKEIFDYFSMLSEVDTEGVKPSFHPIEIRNRLREDIPKKPISQQDALKNASNPNSQNIEGYFKGPKAV